MSKRLLRLLAVLLAFTLVAAACGGDDDDDGAASGDDTAASTDDGSSGDDDGSASSDDDGGAAAEGVVEFAAGTTVDISECPEDWSDTTNWEIRDEDGLVVPGVFPDNSTLDAFNVTINTASRTQSQIICYMRACTPHGICPNW